MSDEEAIPRHESSASRRMKKASIEDGDLDTRAVLISLEEKITKFLDRFAAMTLPSGSSIPPVVPISSALPPFQTTSSTHFNPLPQPKHSVDNLEEVGVEDWYDSDEEGKAETDRQLAWIRQINKGKEHAIEAPKPEVMNKNLGTDTRKAFK